MTRNVLLILDDPRDADIIQKALISSNDNSFRVFWVRNCIEGVERLVKEGKQEKERTDGIAVVLTDLFLTDGRGIETFDRLFHAAPQIPILVLSALRDEDVAKLAVQRGALDYLFKGFIDSPLLPRELKSMIEYLTSEDAMY